MSNLSQWKGVVFTRMLQSSHGILEGTLGFVLPKQDGTFPDAYAYHTGQTFKIYAYDITPYFRTPTPQELQQLTELRVGLDLALRFASLNAHGGYTLGSDPEIFVIDGRGRVIPAFTFLPPKAVATEEGFNDKTISAPIYWDGFQAEFKVTPHGCLAFIVDEFQQKLKTLRDLAQEANPKASLTASCVLPVSMKLRASAKPEHLALGCAPSYNAYGDRGEVVVDGKELPLRFAGLHVHIQKEKREDYTKIAEVVKFIDATAGVMSVSVLAGLENPIRRKFYGLAGEYRLPKHGLEYRVLSSTPLWHPAMVHLMFGLVRSAYGLYFQEASDLWKTSEDEVREVVNNLDVDQARKIIQRNREVLKYILKGIWSCKPEHIGKIINQLFLKGVKQWIDLDIPKNWHFDDDLWVTHSEGPECNFSRFSTEAIK